MRPSIFGISFDGLPISGIINAFVDVATIYRDYEYRVFFDLGYDIEPQNSHLGPSPAVPSWVNQVSLLGSQVPIGYSRSTIDRAKALVNRGEGISTHPDFMALAQRLSVPIADFFRRRKVRLIVVENGTLPNNPIFTAALDLAIEMHGQRHQLGPYVLWRDHDLMWASLPYEYGPYPYPGVRKPYPSRYIVHAVLSEWMRVRVLAWAPGSHSEVIPNCFHFRERRPSGIRAAFGIPPDALLIARCTRIIPAKHIERDLRLLELLQRELQRMGDARKIYLFVTAPTQEDAQEFDRLREIQAGLKCRDQVIWGDGLDHGYETGKPRRLRGEPKRFSVPDLLAESDLSSFLTSYDYEGFGNPPAEATAMGIPYISTNYEVYQDIYGKLGAIAPLLPIERNSSASDEIPDFFLQWTLRTLLDPIYRAEIVAKNREVIGRHYSAAALKQRLDALFSVSEVSH